MGLFDSIKNLATKATELAGEHSDAIGGGVDKVGDMARERFGDNEYIDKGIEAAKGAVDGDTNSA
jgi:hypothetical protein